MFPVMKKAGIEKAFARLSLHLIFKFGSAENKR
jgi:hypothetical protein